MSGLLPLAAAGALQATVRGTTPGPLAASIFHRFFSFPLSSFSRDWGFPDWCARSRRSTPIIFFPLFSSFFFPQPAKVGFKSHLGIVHFESPESS